MLTTALRRSIASLARHAPRARVTVRMPATSANMGPGFDSLGIALANQATTKLPLRRAVNNCPLQPMSTGETSAPGRQENEAWDDVYDEGSPARYFQDLFTKDHAMWHDQLVELFAAELDAFVERTGGERELLAVEFAALYGNATMAYKYGLRAHDVERAWHEDEWLPAPRHNIRVVASDLDEKRLQYGLRRGLFAEVHAHDLNEPVLPEALARHMAQADVLVWMLGAYYMQLPLYWQRMVLQFLSDRRREKLVVYTDSPPFQPANFSPEALFAGVPGWTSVKRFMKVRNFSLARPEGATEFWMNVYVVRFRAAEDRHDPYAHPDECQ